MSLPSIILGEESKLVGVASAGRKIWGVAIIAIKAIVIKFLLEMQNRLISSSCHFVLNVDVLTPARDLKWIYKDRQSCLKVPL